VRQSGERQTARNKKRGDKGEKKDKKIERELWVSFLFNTVTLKQFCRRTPRHTFDTTS